LALRGDDRNAVYNAENDLARNVPKLPAVWTYGDGDNDWDLHLRQKHRRIYAAAGTF